MLRVAGLARIRKLDLTPPAAFHSWVYLRHNHRRLEHLASLGLPIAGCSVLEVAAGIGDHTSFFLDRGCTVVSTDGRQENLEILQERFRHTSVETAHLDLDAPAEMGRQFDIVYCYGALYHLHRPAEAIAFMAGRCRSMLLLETRVSFGDDEEVNLADEPAENPTESIVGCGCRPTRPWVFARLKQHFEHVYVPRTQPNHSDFPLNWKTTPAGNDATTRAIFIASRAPLDNPILSEELLTQQVRQN